MHFQPVPSNCIFHRQLSQRTYCSFQYTSTFSLLSDADLTAYIIAGNAYTYKYSTTVVFETGIVVIHWTERCFRYTVSWTASIFRAIKVWFFYQSMSHCVSVMRLGFVFRSSCQMLAIYSAMYTGMMNGSFDIYMCCHCHGGPWPHKLQLLLMLMFYKTFYIFSLIFSAIIKLFAPLWCKTS